MSLDLKNPTAPRLGGTNVREQQKLYVSFCSVNLLIAEDVVIVFVCTWYELRSHLRDEEEALYSISLKFLQSF